MGILRTIALIVLGYLIIRFVGRLYNAASSSNNQSKKKYSGNTTSKKNRKANYGKTEIEDADYIEIKDKNDE
ncbi:hypothetical protein [Luteibaculum oceani]|uniref:DUF4834 family protein n=1 Tax=Luteibaculum oceani TaxID=1294296 RepID=A0A5C6V8V9_9FLAO|nr:hypothetical protein [Luteibaculum oceani]TXC81539.1 hypothetical protein FRX97_05895 [Luteibaculum oceani]